MIGSAADLFGAFALKREPLDLRGKQVFVQEMSGLARSEIYEAMKSEPMKANALCVLHCVVDGGGKRLFGPGDLENIQTQLPTDFIDAVATKVMDLAGVGKGAAAPKD